MARGIFERGEILNITLYQFAKKLNSTARPSGTSKGVQGQLRESCSMLAPEIGFVSFGQTESPHAWNYAYIPDFGRFYFIDNWTWTAGMWYASMTVDPLASWRNEIANSTVYIVRAASAVNPDIIDTTYPTLSYARLARQDLPAIYTDNVQGGTFIFGVQASGYNAFGSTTTIACKAESFKKLMTKLLSDTDYLNIDPNEISGNLAKALFNPIQYFSFAYWLPFGAGFPDASAVESVPVGWWRLDVGDKFWILDQNNDSLKYRFNVAIPKHPAADSKHSYLKATPYSTYKMYMPGFGLIDIDSSRLYNASRLYGSLAIDLYTGNAVLELSARDDYKAAFQTLTGNVAVQIQIGQITSMVNTAGGVVQAVAGGVVAGAQSFFQQAADITRKVHDWINGAETLGIGQNATSIANGIQSGAQQATAESVSKGGQGSVVEYGYTPYLLGKFWDLVGEAPEHRGYPLCEKRKIGSLSGYIMCSDSDFSAPATSMEISAIREHLNNGFYFE